MILRSIRIGRVLVFWKKRSRFLDFASAEFAVFRHVH